MFLELFHLGVLSINSYAIWYDQMYVDLPFPSKEIEDMPVKARHIFLTFWCLLLQTLYFALSFLNDLYGTNTPAPKKPPLIRKTKDILFSLSFAVAIYVSMAFWCIYTIDKDLIMPEEIESRLPSWINHVMHSLIAPFIVMEMFTTKKTYPSRTLGVKITICFIMAYIIWIHTLYFQTGIWVYPFMGAMNWLVRAVFCVMSTGTGLGFYVLGEKLNSLVSPMPETYTNGHIKKH